MINIDLCMLLNRTACLRVKPGSWLVALPVVSYCESQILTKKLKLKKM